MVEAFPEADRSLRHRLQRRRRAVAPVRRAGLRRVSPTPDITVLADASGVYADNPPVNEAIGTLWGTFNNILDWPELEGLEPRDYSVPGLFVNSGHHDPDIRFARYDNAYDEVQQSFSSLAGLGDGDLLSIIQTNEAAIEDAGVPVASYIAPGTDHTILG